MYCSRFSSRLSTFFSIVQAPINILTVPDHPFGRMARVIYTNSAQIGLSNKNFHKQSLDEIPLRRPPFTCRGRRIMLSEVSKHPKPSS
jgi:hypothetical protein